MGTIVLSFEAVTLLSFSWRNLMVATYVLTIIATVVVVILDKRNPTKAMLWILILALLPVVGLILYIFFGRNLRPKRIFKRKEPMDLTNVPEELQPYTIPLNGAAERPPLLQQNIHIARLLLNNSRAPVFSGNSVEIFHHGAPAFESLIADLEAARSFIHMEYFIFEDDELGTAIGDLLIRKAQEGVEVRFIYDDVGSFHLSRRYKRKLREGGVAILPFQKINFPFLTSRINYRNHRKITVVDGVIAHMGGMNIANKYVHGDKLGLWHDTQLRIKGPVVHSLHEVFLTDWQFVTRNPDVEQPAASARSYQEENITMQISASGPDTDWASIMQSFFLAISRAKRYIYITTPYFIPNESILMALRTAALSGVDVRIILPGESDVAIVLWATKSYILSLLESGIKVYLFQNAFNHSKTMMVDGEVSIVGSANMDIRSFETHFEVVSFIYDERVTRELEKEFVRDAMQSQQVDPEKWANRPLRKRFRDATARLLSPLF